MIAVYTGETPPTTFTKSLFLAGPSPRTADHPEWRSEALAILEDLEYDGVVFVPLFRNGPKSGETFDFEDQVGWETTHLNMADLVVFWVPRDMKTLPGLTTNVEWGIWFNSGKAILGYPSDGYPKPAQTTDSGLGSERRL